MLYLAHLLGLVVTALVSAGVAWWVRRQTDDRAGTAMVALLAVHAAMATFATAQLLASTESGQVFWYRLWYLLSLGVPVIWYLLAVYYTGRGYWLTKPVWAVLLASAVLPVVLWLTNPVHGLFVTEFRYRTDPFPFVQADFAGPSLLVVGAINVYTVFAFGLFLLTLLSARREVRVQSATVLLGIAAIWVTTALTLTELVPAPGFPYGVYGAGIFGSLVAVALFRTRMFAVAPLARDLIFESVGDAIVVVDARRTIVDYNAAAAELLADIDRYAGADLDDAYPALVDDDDQACDGGGVEAIVEKTQGTSETPFAGKVRVAADDGARTLRVSVSEIASGGEPRGYALIMRDVTELERYATDLEHKTEQLERFASVLSHDLRNPVAVATGYVQESMKTGDPDQLRTALRALERIDETIDNLLSLSREGATIEDPEVVSLRRAVADAWSTSDTGDAVLETDIDAAYRIRADPDRLRTMLENLFRNAVDHGGDTVRVATLPTGFCVSDDGPGVPEEERDRIFEYGYSTSNSGTGIGLAIVSSIASAHGWTIAVTESARGGARFEITGVDRD